jgi:lipopolysaccharide export system protein LptC
VKNQEPTIGVSKRDGYSNLVNVLKWAFPVVGVVLVGSIFLLSNASKLSELAEVIDGPLAELAVGQRITNPNFSGVTKSGDAFSIVAEWALPDGAKPTKVELSKPRTTINFQDGRTMRTTAGLGALNLRSSEATLSDGVNMRTTDGYIATSTSIEINFETGNLYSKGPVMAEGPVGSIEAGSMTLTQNLDQNPTGNAVLVFNNGVKLIYNPAEG